MIQKGLKPSSEKIEMPNWIDRLQTETIEDFLDRGRQAYYPNEGVTFQSDHMIKNLGMSNLTTKESKALLSHVNKTMREMQKAIILARRAQEEKLVKMEKHVQNMKKRRKIQKNQEG
jgi:hypothetical protein